MSIIKKENPIILNEFLNYLITLNYSLNTVKAYCSDLLIFFKFYKEYENINVDISFFNVIILSKVNKADIIAFIVYLNQNKDNNPYTRQRRLTSIRMFFEWLFTQYPQFEKMKNPAKEVQTTLRIERLPKYLSIEKSKKILNIFNKSNCTYPLRNNIIIYLLLNTGMRVSELSNININDINFKEKYIKVIGKGNKERKVFINEQTKEKILKYIKYQYKTINTNINNPLFINKKRNRLGVSGIENICKKAFKLANLEEYGYTTHTLRHTTAVLLYQYGNVDINVLKKILGHNSIVSTQIYTHVYNEKIKRAVNSNPLNDFNCYDISA